MAVGWLVRMVDRMRGAGPGEVMDFATGVGGEREGGRLWIRLPNWLGDVIMALPIIRAIAKARPDVEINLVGQAHFGPFLEMLGVGAVFRPLPKKEAKGYYGHFKQFRAERRDCYLLFTNSFRGDLEAWQTGCGQRMGMLRAGKARPLLTDSWKVPGEVDEAEVHQMRVWERMMRSFGLEEALDLTPIRLAGVAEDCGSKVVGLICGTENDPSKRWPVGRWRELIEQAHERWPEVRIKLFGTAKDGEITAQVAEGMGEHVEDVAGKTDLVDFAKALTRCAVLVCNDTGGMHIANALGVPVVGIFGPTNPVRTGPIFEGKVAVVQPEGCPKTGGMAIEGVGVEAVVEAMVGSL